MSVAADTLSIAVPPASPSVCVHCGETLPKGASRFCCAGCAGAYALISEIGLSRFYRDRTPDEAGRLRPTGKTRDDAPLFAISRGDGTATLDAMVDGVHCPACVWLIESALARRSDVVEARVNLTSRRLHLRWRGEPGGAAALVEFVERLGFRTMPYDAAHIGQSTSRAEGDLLRAMAVAGFAAANVMLLSVAVWAGLAGEMGPATRDLMHWVSALIALPAIAYAGQPFFRSAVAALRRRHANMDLPISIGILLAAGVSLIETMRSGPHAYFDSAVTLLFFLLIGRYLDSRARGRARESAEHLLTLGAQTATRLDPEGNAQRVKTAELRTDDLLLVVAGERIAADGTIIAGATSVDKSLLDGESLPAPATVGDRVLAGMLNIGDAIRVRIDAVGDRTFLAEIVRLMEAAEQGHAKLVLLADRVARLYAPAVHLLALATFVGWIWFVGWETALLNAIAVLIITCPCALGLAVPVVQIVASGRLLRGGLLLKSATALERLAQVDSIVFDKTGTLTEGRFVLQPDGARDPDADRLAASMAASSRHPLSRALAASYGGVVPGAPVREEPGRGLMLDTPEGAVRLGSRAFCGIADKGQDDDGVTELWLSQPGHRPVRFAFSDRLRPGAGATIARLRDQGKRVILLSGDRAPVVQAVADRLGISEWRACVSPQDKCAALAGLADAGHKVLMVGDGLNDAPALAAAYVSLSPATAADLSQNAADAVFQGTSLDAVTNLLSVAKRADRLVRENIAVAIAYNCAAVPLAMSGHVTPLVAAIAMSSSSLIVVGNALRLAGSRRGSRG